MKDSLFAVLIDAENVPSAPVKEMLEEIARHGTPTIKRIYADWTRPNVSGWKNVLLENAITPIQQYSYTSGKNSTDSALIIDAMDLLYSGKVDGFCIVSSDSDFTRLAIRLREAGMQVIGIGEKKTPLPFITACDKFIYIEILRKAAPVEKKARETKRKGAAAHEHHPLNKVDSSVVNLLMQSVMDLADEDGWAPLSTLGHFILKRKPDFDPRNYGFAKLLSLIRSLDRWLVIDERETGNRNTRNIFVRIK